MQHMKSAFMQFVDNVGPDQHAHPCSVIWAFSVRRHMLQYPLILQADNEGPDQPALMRRLIRTFVVRKLHKGPFCASCIICPKDLISNCTTLINGPRHSISCAASE